MRDFLKVYLFMYLLFYFSFLGELGLPAVLEIFLDTASGGSALAAVRGLLVASCAAWAFG